MRESAEGLKKILDPNKSKFLKMLPDGDFVGGTMADVSEKLSGLTVGYTETMAL